MEQVWENHWENLEKPSFFSRFAKWYRLNLRARAVRNAFNRHFPLQGVFVEAGSGSSQTSSRISREGKKLIAVDYSTRALALAKQYMDECKKADIRKLPFKKNHLDGLWNLGVMEHYPAEERHKILREFHRVLKPGGRVLLFWPTPHASDKIVLSFIESLYSFFGKKKQFFPNEPGRVNEATARAELQQAGFNVIGSYMPLWDCWTQMVVVGEK